MQEHFDVLVVGAGISGIGAGYHLQTKCPGTSYAILEGRDTIGGTWDLFKYPGIRSDSDMYTLGFRFKPWKEQEAYEYGIINEKGKVLRRYRELKDRKEKESYTVLIRFIFNLKRMMEKIPGGKSKIGSYAVAALVFLREDAQNLKDDELQKLISERLDYEKAK